METYKRDYGTLLTYNVEDMYDCITFREGRFTKQELDTTVVRNTKARSKITAKQYRQIIMKFLEIYFLQLYSKFNITIYFPFTGLIKLTKSNWRNKTLIYWLWYEQPSYWCYKHVRLLKITRGDSFLQKLENKYKENFDFTMLPEFYQEQKLLKSKGKKIFNAKHINSI